MKAKIVRIESRSGSKAPVPDRTASPLGGAGWAHSAWSWLSRATAPGRRRKARADQWRSPIRSAVDPRDIYLA